MRQTMQVGITPTTTGEGEDSTEEVVVVAEEAQTAADEAAVTVEGEEGGVSNPPNSAQLKIHLYH